MSVPLCVCMVALGFPSLVESPSCATWDSQEIGEEGGPEE